MFVLIFLFIVEIVNTQDFNKIIEAFSKSYSYETKTDYSSAIKILFDVYDASSYEINLRLGWLNYLNGNFVESITYYKKAISLKPGSIEAKFGLTLPLSAMGNWDAVIKQYEDILKIDPNNTTALYRLGLIYYNKADYKNSYKYLEKLVNLYPFNYDGLILFAWTNLKLGKYSQAKLLFQKVLLLSPNDISAQEGLKTIK